MVESRVSIALESFGFSDILVGHEALKEPKRAIDLIKRDPVRKALVQGD